MVHTLRRLERWKLIKTKGEKSSEDVLVLPPLLSSLPSVLRKIILNCAVRGGDHFVLINMYVHSVQMIGVEIASLHRGQVKRMALLPPWVLFFLLLFADIRLLSFDADRWSASAISPDRAFQWNLSVNQNPTVEQPPVWALFGSAAGNRFHRSDPNWFPSWHKQALPRKPASCLSPPLPFLPMTSHNFSISCESSVITRQRAALPVQPLFCGTRCVLSANHRWSLTSVRGCFVKAVIVQGQKDGGEHANAKEASTILAPLKWWNCIKSEWKNVCEGSGYLECSELE